MGGFGSGRRPSMPDDLKRLRGNPGRKKLERAEEVVPVGPPPPLSEVPEFLTQPRERELYRRVISDYLNRRIARPADVHGYARWATYMHRWMAAKEHLDGKQSFYKTVAGDTTRYLPAPQFSDMLNLEGVISKLEDKLGLNPVARHAIIRGLSSVPVDLGGVRSDQAKGEVDKPEAPPHVSPIGFGRMN